MTGNGSAQKVDQSPADIQTQAGAVIHRAFTVNFLFKRHEHSLLEGFADPASGIADRIGMTCMPVRIDNTCLERNSASRPCKLDRITEEIHDDAGHMLRIHHDHAVLAAFNSCLQHLSRRACLLGNDRHSFFEYLPLMDSCTHTDHLSCIDAAGLEDLIDQTCQIVGRGEHFFQIVTNVIRQIFIAEGKLRQTLDRRQGGPHIMAHMGKKCFLLLPGFDSDAKRFGHLLNLFLVSDLFGCIDKGKDKSADISFPPCRFSFRILGFLHSGSHTCGGRSVDTCRTASGAARRTEIRAFLFGHSCIHELLLVCPVRRYAHQVGLSGYGRAGKFNRLHSLQDLMAEGDQIHCRKVIGDVAEGASDIVFRHAELIRNILCKLADIKLAVDHDDTDKGSCKEVCHVIIDRCQLPDLGLVFGVYCIEFFVDGLQFFV